MAPSQPRGEDTIIPSLKRTAESVPKPGYLAPDLPTRDALLHIVIRSLEDDKAENIVVIDLADKSSYADFMVIATGRSQRQLTSMADHLSREFKAAGLGRASIEGLTQGDWVLVDAGDIVIHLFRPEVRKFYNLEKMWGADRPATEPVAV